MFECVLCAKVFMYESASNANLKNQAYMPVYVKHFKPGWCWRKELCNIYDV